MLWIPQGDRRAGGHGPFGKKMTHIRKHLQILQGFGLGTYRALMQRFLSTCCDMASNWGKVC